MKITEKSHIYDLGSYKFNEINDVDLLQYRFESFENFQSSNGLMKSAKSLKFKLKPNSTVPEPYETAAKLIKYAIPIWSQFDGTEKFLQGLKKTIEKLNEKFRFLSGLAEFVVDTKDFEVVEYAKIKTLDENISLYFPVEVKKLVKVNEDEYEVSINFDNPTSLDIGNQANGCQGSHFGYTIIKKKDDKRIRGHILITTFIGFPSRNHLVKSSILKEINTDPDSIKRLVSFSQLCETALNTGRLNSIITTAMGIKSGPDEFYHSERTKRLPNELKILHNTFFLYSPSLPKRCLFA